MTWCSSPKGSLFVFLGHVLEYLDILVSALGHAIQNVWEKGNEAELPLAALLQYLLAHHL